MKFPRLDRAHFFAGILLFGLLAMTARNAVDPDLGWHLRTGQRIVESGHIPHTDPFSFTRAGSPWVAHEWLAEVVFYEIWEKTGAGGLIVFSAAVTTLGFIFLYWRCRASPHWAAAAVALGALAAAPAWGVRPQMFTFTLASCLLWLLERGQDHPRLFLWIPPLFLLWLNLHAGFAFAPGLLVAWGAGLLLEAAAGESAWTEVRRPLLYLGLALLACFALVPLNPSGTQLYRYPLDVLRSSEMRSFINEWFPPDFHHVRYLPVFLIWVALLWSLSGSGNRPKARVFVPLLMTFLAALDAVRHIPLLVLLAVPVIAAGLQGASHWSRFQWFRPRVTSHPLGLSFRAAVLLLMAAFTATRWAELIRNQGKVEAEQFPAQAVEFLRSHQLPGRLFVYYDWGGYAIWKLYPEYRVFVDGRADLYGDELLHQFRQIAELRAGWAEILDRQRVEAILVPPSGALAQALSLDPAWRTGYGDSQAVLFLRKHDPDSPLGTRNPPE